MRTAPPWNRSSDGVIAARRKPTPLEVSTIIMGAVRRKYPAIVQSKGHRTYLFIRAALGGSGAADGRNWCTRDPSRRRTVVLAARRTILFVRNGRASLSFSRNRRARTGLDAV